MTTSEICREAIRSDFQTGMGPYCVFLLILFVINLLCLSCFLVSFCSRVVNCWERAGLLARLCVMCHLPMLCPGSGVVLDLSVSDNCLNSYF